MYKNYLQTLFVILFISAAFVGCNETKKTKKNKKPNFLILMSDNHSWNHLGCYGDSVVKTPNIDKIAAKGVRFNNAFCSSPSCTPARASMLTGQDIWRLEEGANLWGILPKHFEVYPELLEKAGYLVGYEGKGWGPGDTEASGRTRNPGGNQYDSFEEFYNEREKGQPFMFWFSSRDPHRPFHKNGGKKAKIDTSKIVVPPYMPDTKEIKEDIADYYAEIQHFDKEVSGYISLLKEMGQLDNTIIIIVSDNGWQMPRGLANLYDMGTKIPMIIYLPDNIKKPRIIDDFVSLTDLAPTFLDYAGIPIPDYMTAKSLKNILESGKSGIIEPERDFVVTARERHAYVRKNGAGYGGRAIQTKKYLYIKNYDYERWPAGDPPLYGDIDAHMLQYPCAAKMYMLINRDKPDVKPLFNLAFEKRPAEELYDLEKDPYQMNNVAAAPEYKEIKKKMSDKLNDYLTKTKDPRVIGGDMKWIDAEYYAEVDKTPRPGRKAIEALNLKEEYNYDE